MKIEELKAKIEREIASLRERANTESDAGRDEDACALDTAADYLAKVVRWIDDVGDELEENREKAVEFTKAGRAYSVDDMRKVASGKMSSSVSLTFDERDVANMLLKGADAIEREARREKRYEYRVLYRRCDGRVDESIGHTEDIKIAREILRIYAGYKDAHIVCREIGEWQEVTE